MSMRVSDQESKSRYLSGYPSLAAFIASDRDRTTLIFRRFDQLAARNLLYLQSELAELEWKQHAFDLEDIKADMATKQCARNWEDFKRAAEHQGNDGQRKRMDLTLKIRSTLKEYREALLSESTLASVPPPSKRILNAFRLGFFLRPFGALDYLPTLGGHSAGLYDDIDDLVALRVPEHQDRLTTFAQDRLGCLFPAGPPNGQVAYESDHKIRSFVAWLSTILAALLLVGAIVALYTVKSPKWRLGLIALFTSLFAMSLGLLTNARRAELFGATAAYSAVLVVSVSGNLGDNPPQ